MFAFMLLSISNVFAEEKGFKPNGYMLCSVSFIGFDYSVKNELSLDLCMSKEDFKKFNGKNLVIETYGDFEKKEATWSQWWNNEAPSELDYQKPIGEKLRFSGKVFLKSLGDIAGNYKMIKLKVTDGKFYSEPDVGIENFEKWYNKVQLKIDFREGNSFKSIQNGTKKEYEASLENFKHPILVYLPRA